MKRSLHHTVKRWQDEKYMQKNNDTSHFKLTRRKSEILRRRKDKVFPVLRKQPSESFVEKVLREEDNKLEILAKSLTINSRIPNEPKCSFQIKLPKLVQLETDERTNRKYEKIQDKYNASTAFLSSERNLTFQGVRHTRDFYKESRRADKNREIFRENDREHHGLGNVPEEHAVLSSIVVCPRIVIEDFDEKEKPRKQVDDKAVSNEPALHQFVFNFLPDHWRQDTSTVRGLYARF